MLTEEDKECVFVFVLVFKTDVEGLLDKLVVAEEEKPGKTTTLVGMRFDSDSDSDATANNEPGW